MVAAQVNTKRSERRTLKFESIAQLREDLAKIEAAHNAGTLRTTGNWTAGEVFDHLAILWEFSLDGFPPDRNPPFIVKLICIPMRFTVTSGKTGSPGFTLPKAASHLLPRSGCTFEIGMARLRRVLDRLDSGEKMTKPSPLFGSLSHQQWTRLHFGHCQLHLGFLHPR